MYVAPLVGAWIEITLSRRESNFVIVAPLVGAWIEIQFIGANFTATHSVAPLVGAWIEILRTAISVSFSASLLSWERGLK